MRVSKGGCSLQTPNDYCLRSETWHSEHWPRSQVRFDWMGFILIIWHVMISAVRTVSRLRVAHILLAEMPDFGHGSRNVFVSERQRAAAAGGLNEVVSSSLCPPVFTRPSFFFFFFFSFTRLCVCTISHHFHPMFAVAAAAVIYVEYADSSVVTIRGLSSLRITCSHKRAWFQWSKYLRRNRGNASQ